MRSVIVLGSALLCVTGLLVEAKQPVKPTKSATQTPKPKLKHPHLHHALWALHHAHHELKVSKEDYQGHKEKAEQAIHHAIKDIEAILKHENDGPFGVPTHHELSEAHKKYAHHPHLHHAIHEVREAHHQLKETKSDFGGLREKALHSTHHAVHQIELVLKHAIRVENASK